YVAVDRNDGAIGFLILGSVDNAAYLDQISVLPNQMRRGIGKTLMERAIVHSGSGPLWLTTYAHLPWNRPYYERFGFAEVASEHCGDGIRAILQKQRAVLPDPDQRIAMVRQLPY